MKKLLIFPLLVLLTGCVTYYYPESALEDGVYYAEDDPAYIDNQGGYPGPVFYPWVSLDYFYMGFYPYPRYPYYYGFPFGLSYGYSPWHYPYGYFGYYSSMYSSYFYYPRYPAWGPYNGYCSHDRVCGGQWSDAGHHGKRRNRHAGNDSDGIHGRGDEVADNEEVTADSLDRLNNGGSIHRAPYRRFVTTGPSGYSGNRGIVIKSREATKIGKDRVQPVHSGSPSNGIVVAGPPSQSSVAPDPRASGGRSAPATGTSVPSSRPASDMHQSSASRPSRPAINSNRARPRSPESHRAPKSRSPRNENHD